MRKQLFIPFGIGVVVIAAAVAGILYMQRGAHIQLSGSLLKVRTQAMDEASSVAVIDFRVRNPSDYFFVVRRVDVTLQTKDGKEQESTAISEVDAKNLFQYYPLLGQKFNDTLLMRDRISPRGTLDRMVAARFELPESEVQSRKTLTIRIEEVDGVVAVLNEK